MSKQFTIRRDEKGAILIPNSILKDGEIIDEEEIVDLLNEFQEEIQKLTTKGLEILNFYESKLVNAYGTEEYQTVNDELSTVRFVLCEMGVLNR